MQTTENLAIAAALCMTCTAALSAQAPDPAAAFPSRPVRFVIGFTAGGQPDIISRILAAKLTEGLGQQFVIDNRPGAGGTIGTKTVVDATPDGHTLLAVSSSFAISPALYAKLPYDPRRDLAGITTLATAPYMLVVPPSLAAKSVQELIALAKAKPGQLNFSSAGVGSGTHFAAELFKSTAQIDVVHVPYKGIPEAVTDTMTGRVQFLMTPSSTIAPLLKEGKLRALAVSSTQRVPGYPDVPTVAEAGLPGYLWVTWAAMFAPAKTPRPIVEKLSRAVAAGLALPDVKQRYAALGVDPAPRTPTETDKFIDSEITRIGSLARKAGINPQ